MTVVLVTGMSGAGKSTALAELARRGHRVVDTDHGGWSEDVPLPGEDGSEQLWREDRMDALLADPPDRTLFIAGCVANQVKFYPRFDAIVLLSAPTDVLLDRIVTRRTNHFGKTAAERTRILDDLRTFEPRLRAGATAEIDTRRPVHEVAGPARVNRDEMLIVPATTASDIALAAGVFDKELRPDAVEPCASEPGHRLRLASPPSRRRLRERR